MNLIFNSYPAGAEIPATEYLANIKLAKYFNRETAATIVCMGELHRSTDVDPKTPFYFALGTIEFEDYGLHDITAGSRDAQGHFSNESFIKDALPRISPLNQFKVLQNMPLSFVSIAFGLVGDNAVLYDETYALLLAGRYAPTNGPILLGASKAYRDGRVEAAVALTDKHEMAAHTVSPLPVHAIELFKEWQRIGDTDA